ncbi:MAG: chorismate mutase, partial [Clostridium sp.]|nr:chorismate mutase [Clostridium sp.]
MDDLKKLRDEIDTVDTKLTELYEKRLNLVLKVADYKKENNIPVLNSSREDEVIKKNVEHLKNDNFKEPTKDFFKSIMNISKMYEKKRIDCLKVPTNKKEPASPSIKVGFQGVPGSFSYEAFIKYFSKNAPFSNYNTFEDVFTAIKACEINYGVLPIENSSTGGISEVYDLLKRNSLYITGEKCIKVSHNLLAKKGTTLTDITEVYSHTQAFEQSSTFLKNHSNFKLIPYYNTAISAKLVHDRADKNIAAIASKEAAKLYGLDILEENINYNLSNYTRFIIISDKLQYNNSCNKISIILGVSHKTGSLFNILKIFADNTLNMLKIESRPIEGTPWEYLFYIDFEGNLDNSQTKNAISS